MTTNYHTPIATGATNAPGTINTPLAALDAAIGAISGSGGNMTLVNDGAGVSAAQKVVTVDSSTGFVDGASVVYPLAGGAIEYNTIGTVDSTTQITLTTNIGAGGIADNAIFAQVTPDIASIRSSINTDQTLTPAAAVGYAGMNVYNAKAYGADESGTQDTYLEAAAAAADTAGGGVVFVPQGKYEISDVDFSSYTNVSLQGQGKGSILKVTSQSGSAIDLGAYCSLKDLTIEFGVDSTLRSASERALVYVSGSNVIISNIVIDIGSNTSNQTVANKANGIQVDAGAVNVIIDGCILLGPDDTTASYDASGLAGWGIKISDSVSNGVSINVSDCIIKGWNDAIKISCPSASAIIDGCQLSENNRDGVDCYYSGGGNIIVSNCLIHDNYDEPADFKVFGNPTAAGDTSDYAVLFTGNILYNHNADGLGSGAGVLSFAGNNQVSVINNIIKDSNRGLSVAAGSGAIVANNQIFNVQEYGIACEGYLALVTVTGQTGNYQNGEGLSFAGGGSATLRRSESGKLFVTNLTGTQTGVITGDDSGATSTTDTVYDNPQQATLITNNRIYNAGLGDGEDTAKGIRLNQCEGVVISNNSIFWDEGYIATLENESAIFGGPSGDPVNCVITNNITNKSAVVISITTQTNNWIYGNVALGGNEDGSIQWDDSSSRLQVHDGTAWRTLAAENVENTFTIRQNITLTSDDLGLVITGASGQSANLLQVKANDGDSLFTVQADGDVAIGSVNDPGSLLTSENIYPVNTSGLKIGTNVSDKIGFWNATPVVQQSHIADPAGGGTVDAEARTAINSINALLATLGLTAAS